MSTNTIDTEKTRIQALQAHHRQEMVVGGDSSDLRSESRAWPVRIHDGIPEILRNL
jgi:hypothetical protein